jgi:hypothetical protein
VPVTRADIAQHVATAFIGGAAGRFDLLGLARASHAPGEVLQVLSALPDRRYGHLYELWDCLPEVPGGGAHR